ncbi:Sec-independent protein translocase protein TatB [Sphingopyxis sp. 550A]
MFDVAPTELLLVIVVALVVIGPKDLPKAMRFVGKWVGKARGMARHFRAGLDTMMREAELEELEKQWREQNDAIMREFPRIDDVAAGTPPILPAEAPAETSGSEEAEVAKPETHDVPPPGGPLP